MAKLLIGDDILEDLHVIDMHCHLGLFNNNYFPYSGIKLLIEEADRIGIEKIAIAANASLANNYKLGNRQIYEAICKFSDRVYGFVTLNPNKYEEIDIEFDRYYHIPQFIGIKIYPSFHRYPLDGKNYRAVFNGVQRHGGFIMVHTWESDATCTVEKCEIMLKQYPDVSLILTHSFGSPDGIFKTIRLVNEYDNAYMDTTGFKYTDVNIEEIVNHVNVKKVFYGSDMPFLEMRNGLSRILYADIDDRIKKRILSENFRKLLISNTKHLA